MGTKNRHERGVLDAYRKWLVSLVDTPDGEFSRYYSRLMDQMFGTDYRWIIERDYDRYVDGIMLRKEYCENNHVDISAIMGSRCSVLECLAALFVKYSDTVLTDPGGISVAPELFYDAMEHLGLLVYDDSRYDEYAVYDIFERFLDCKFLLFPVTFWKKSEGLWGVVGKFSMQKW